MARSHTQRPENRFGEEQPHHTAVDAATPVSTHLAAHHLSPRGLMRMQRVYGNRAVQRFLVQRKPKASRKGKKPPPSILLTIADIKGDCKLPGHEGKIEVISMSHGPTTRSDVTGGGPGARQQGGSNTISFEKYQDSTSPTFLQEAAQGNIGRTAKFEVLSRTPDGKVLVKQTHVYKNVLVADYTTSAGKPATDVIELNFTDSSVDIVVPPDATGR